MYREEIWERGLKINKDRWRRSESQQVTGEKKFSEALTAAISPEKLAWTGMPSGINSQQTNSCNLQRHQGIFTPIWAPFIRSIGITQSILTNSYLQKLQVYLLQFGHQLFVPLVLQLHIHVFYKMTRLEPTIPASKWIIHAVIDYQFQ